MCNPNSFFAKFIYICKQPCYTLIAQKRQECNRWSRGWSPRRFPFLQERMIFLETVAAVQMKNVTKCFGEVLANNKVNLELRRGEILSLLGENGSGKTTLMNMLAGIYYPDDGQIYVNGRAVTICSPKDAFDLGIGMIHQHFKLVDVFTAAENIVLGLHEAGKLDRKVIAAKVRGNQRPVRF